MLGLSLWHKPVPKKGNPTWEETQIQPPWCVSSANWHKRENRTQVRRFTLSKAQSGTRIFFSPSSPDRAVLKTIPNNPHYVGIDHRDTLHLRVTPHWRHGDGSAYVWIRLVDIVKYTLWRSTNNNRVERLSWRHYYAAIRVPYGRKSLLPLVLLTAHT